MVLNSKDKCSGGLKSKDDKQFVCRFSGFAVTGGLCNMCLAQSKPCQWSVVESKVRYKASSVCYQVGGKWLILDLYYSYSLSLVIDI